MNTIVPFIVSFIIIIVGIIIIIKNKILTKTLLKNSIGKSNSPETFLRFMVYFGGIFFIITGIIALIGNLRKII